MNNQQVASPVTSQPKAMNTKRFFMPGVLVAIMVLAILTLVNMQNINNIASSVEKISNTIKEAALNPESSNNSFLVPQGSNTVSGLQLYKSSEYQLTFGYRMEYLGAATSKQERLECGYNNNLMEEISFENSNAKIYLNNCNITWDATTTVRSEEVLAAGGEAMTLVLEKWNNSDKYLIKVDYLHPSPKFRFLIVNDSLSESQANEFMLLAREIVESLQIWI